MKIRKIVVALLGATLLFTPTKVYGEERVTNRFDDWKTTAIISPKSGELKPAGPIEIEFNQLVLDDVTIDHYDLYLDGEDQPQDTIETNEDDILVGEVYTTDVAVHNVQVVAVTDDNYEISSSARQFLVSKKGISVDNKAGQVEYPVANMNESWCYNWSTEPYHYNQSGSEFIPMVWNDATIDWLSTAKENGYDTVLGFNEPDLANQANLSVDQATKYYNDFKDSGLRIGSPVIAYDTTWFANYMKAIDNDVDFIPMHIYMRYPSKDQVKWAIDQIVDTYETYKKPIWITEIAFASDDSNWNGLVSGNSEFQPKVNDVMEMLINGVEASDNDEGFDGLDDLPYVERYAWFSFDTLHTQGGVSSLYETNSGTSLNKGQLTQLGELYKSLGNPYVDEDDDLSDIYVEDDAYYKNLDDMIAEADKLVASADYQNYINVEAFEKALKDAKAIDRTYGSNNQYIVDDLTNQLKKEYEQLQKKVVTENVAETTSESNENVVTGIVTGDATNIVLFVVLIVLSAGGYIFVKKKRLN